MTKTVALTLAAFFLTVPPGVNAGDQETENKKELAEKVAKKVDKARVKAQKAEQEPLEADRQALRKFHEDVTGYAELSAKQVAKVGKPKGVDAAVDAAAQKALARAIQLKRATARQGDIFGPAVAPIFRRLIAVELRGPDGLPARKAVVEGNPGQEEDSVPIVVRVNGEYETGAAFSTVPSSVLLTLPPLPEGLQYRFVGRQLILLDSAALLIVDFLPLATPSPQVH